MKLYRNERGRLIECTRDAGLADRLGWWNGIAAGDVDGDGKEDLYLVQNFYGSQRETGRMDGGVSLLLLGNGDGTFERVWPNRSGLVVPGDAKSLTTADVNGDGWVDFVVGVNNGDLLAFENRGSSTHRVITVKLQGRPGNPTGVGSRVTVHLKSGARQTAEVDAGGGYLSQSSSALAFGLGATNQVRQVEVRWPNGEVTSHGPWFVAEVRDLGGRDGTRRFITSEQVRKEQGAFHDTLAQGSAIRIKQP